MTEGYRQPGKRAVRRPRVMAWLILGLLGSRYTGSALGEDYDYGYMPPQQPMRAGGRAEGNGVMGPLAVGVGSFVAAKWFLSGRRKTRAKAVMEKDMEQEHKKMRMEVTETSRQFDEYEAALGSALKQKQAEAGMLEEFLYSLPDTNKDGLISRFEFERYMSDYKKTHPGLTDRDLPRFEDMDHNNNGHINFQEARTDDEEAEEREVTGDLKLPGECEPSRCDARRAGQCIVQGAKVYRELGSAIHAPGLIKLGWPIREYQCY